MATSRRPSASVTDDSDGSTRRLRAWMVAAPVDMAAIGGPAYWLGGHWKGLLLGTMLTVVFLTVRGLYRARRLAHGLDELPAVVACFLVAMASVTVVIAVRHDTGDSVTGFLLMAVVSLAALVAGRLLTGGIVVRARLHHLGRRPRSEHIGTGPVARVRGRRMAGPGTGRGTPGGLRHVPHQVHVPMIRRPVASDRRVVSLVRDLASFGDRVAALTADETVTYVDLSRRMAALDDAVAGERRLVLVQGSNDLATLTNYLAALSAGHVVMLAPGGSVPSSVSSAYDPDIVMSTVDGRPTVDVRRTRARQALHPELTLLLSTSGSTGSAKLVRLSYDNLESNARAIGDYLAIGPEDRAATTLPMYYCYGLSVIHSHLMRGASLLLTQASVADEGYWELFRAAGATSFAGVPHTFDLLDRTGFADMDLPDLRYVTQAGGRMDPEKVRRYARLGRERGWRLYVMYGQTEATARMAYLPPELAERRPECVGIAIPGGSLRIDPIPESPDPAVGELVYTGPNVMLGYAATRADLAAGPSVSELRTGDIARQHPDGLFEIVGRRSRFLKLFGLRVDLEQVEAHLARHGYPAACTGDDTTLRVAVSGTVAAAEIGRLVAQLLQVPSRVVDVRTGVDLPRTESGKVDYAAIARLFDDAPPVAGPPRRGPAGPGGASAAPSDGGVRRIFVEVLERQDIRDDDTFVSLGGDSLSYVEMTVRLEQALGELPPDWHTTTLRDLDRRQAAGPRPGRRSWRRSIEGSLALRAASIALIVASHAGLVKLHGMALALLAAVGFNFARFTLSTDERRERVRRAATTAARMAAIALPVIAVVTALSPHYRFENYLFGDSLWLPYPYDWESHFWFIFAVLYFLLAMVVVVAVRGFTRIERRHRFAVPAVLMFVGLVARYQLIPGVTLPTPVKLLWLFAIGWAAASATHAWHRVLISIVTIVSLIDFVPNSPWRNNVAIICVLFLIWVTSVPTIGAVNWVAGLLAASSLGIYVTHWAILYQLSPLGLPPWILVSVALLVGVAYHQVAKRVLASVEEGLRRRRSRGGGAGPATVAVHAGDVDLRTVGE